MNITNREQEILYLLALGLSCQDISKELKISIRTVQTHMQRLFTKLGARNRANAAAIYIQSLSPQQQASMRLRYDSTQALKFPSHKRIK